ncbi:sigma factor [Thermoactinomyces mirandus]|uniref:RNA polymerase sigma factor SigI n=1 Tax=Thermoactinomyces mirandus TaxID=2756294 RepID=A0A7W1XSA6_9BACL|nr:sigma factor [Thermoactinomyces mirandus]MBA4602237.1 hypothetical protein [Thermoactinomyces mirandus]
MFRGTDLERRVLLAQETRSPDKRNDLLKELEPQVRRIASSVCRREITKQDDEYMIAYKALDEAISGYCSGFQATFMSFAYKVIHRRLIDYFRHEKKHRRIIPLVNYSGTSDEETPNPEVVAKAFENHRNEELKYMRQMEIEMFRKSLARYGITFEELVKKSPKHRDTRENLYKIAAKIVSDQDLLQKFLQQKKLDKEISSALGMHRRTLSRHRKYLIALTIVMTEDLTLIRSHLGLKG